MLPPRLVMYYNSLLSPSFAGGRDSRNARVSLRLPWSHTPLQANCGNCSGCGNRCCINTSFLSFGIPIITASASRFQLAKRKPLNSFAAQLLGTALYSESAASGTTADFGSGSSRCNYFTIVSTPVISPTHLIDTEDRQTRPSSAPLHRILPLSELRTSKLTLSALFHLHRPSKRPSRLSSPSARLLPRSFVSCYSSAQAKLSRYVLSLRPADPLSLP